MIRPLGAEASYLLISAALGLIVGGLFAAGVGIVCALR